MKRKQGRKTGYVFVNWTRLEIFGTCGQTSHHLLQPLLIALVDFCLLKDLILNLQRSLGILAVNWTQLSGTNVWKMMSLEIPNQNYHLKIPKCSREVHTKIIEHPQNSHECPGDVPSFPWHYCGYLPSTVEDPNALDPRTITTSSLRFAAVTAQMSFLEFFTSKFFTNTKNDQLFLKQNVIFNKFILKILDFSNWEKSIVWSISGIPKFRPLPTFLSIRSSIDYVLWPLPAVFVPRFSRHRSWPEAGCTF